MSKYSENQTQFKDAELLVQALAEMGYTTVEVNKEAQNLVGYHGDTRADKAEIIVRRAYIGKASNDIGFRRNVNGTYGAIISDFDSHRHNAQWLSKLKVKYAEKGIMRTAARQGLRFTGSKVVNGKSQFQFVKVG